MLLRIIVAAVAGSIMLLPGISGAEVEGVQLFGEGSYAPNGGGNLGSGGGGAFGFRYQHLGCRIGTFYKKDVSTAASETAPAPPNSAGYAVNTVEVSKGQDSPSIGLDLDFYYDVTRDLSVYVSPGLYTHTEQKVLRNTDNYHTIVTTENDRSWLTVRSRRVLEVVASAGIQYGIPVRRDLKIIVGAGYHTLRGPTLALGFMW